MRLKKHIGGGQSIFDSITCDDLIIAFFPCIHFCDAKTLYFRGESIGQKNWSMDHIMDTNIEMAKEREYFFLTLMKLVSVCSKKTLRMIIENPYNTSGMTYLENNFIAPTVVDKNRMRRGDYFIKPTAYWYIGCTPTYGITEQNNKKRKVIMETKRQKAKGLCSEERSMISPDYARNFICDFILGKEQIGSQLQLF